MPNAHTTKPATPVNHAGRARSLAAAWILLALLPFVAGGAFLVWRKHFDPHRPRKVCVTHYEAYRRTTIACTYYEYNPISKQMEEVGRSY